MSRPPGTPPLANLGSLIGDPARALMLEALMSGMALTATELALEADVATSTASSHLAKLTRARVVAVERQGRHKYFRIADDEIAEMLESIVGVAARRTPSVRIGPADPALREARVCYDHLAGARGVWLLDRLRARGYLAGREGGDVTPSGRAFFAELEIDVDALARGRRPLCRFCLDWSERRDHLAGALGAAVLDRMLARHWARRAGGSRAIRITPDGDRWLRAKLN